MFSLLLSLIYLIFYLQCVKGCLSKGGEKPGYCPSKNTTLSPFAAVCMETCQMDTQCPGVTKCCRHSCGVTCQPPRELNSAVGMTLDLTVMSKSNLDRVKFNHGNLTN